MNDLVAAFADFRVVRESADAFSPVPAPMAFGARSPFNHDLKPLNLGTPVCIFPALVGYFDRGDDKESREKTLVCRDQRAIMLRELYSDLCFEGIAEKFFGSLEFERFVYFVPQPEEVVPCMLKPFVEEFLRNGRKRGEKYRFL